MIEDFLDMIRGIGIFIICAQAVTHFRPKASYEKYLKVLVSIIVLVMLMLPCFKALGDVETFFSDMDRYESMLSGQIIKTSYEEEIGIKETEVNSGLNKPIETVVIEPVEVKE